MIDLKVGPGPCFALVRPYHLTSLEVPLSAVRAARDQDYDRFIRRELRLRQELLIVPQMPPSPRIRNSMWGLPRVSYLVRLR